MPEENGWTEGFRIKFPTDIGERLRIIADQEGRSIQNLIKYFTIKGLAEWHFERELPAYILKILNGDGKTK